MHEEDSNEVKLETLMGQVTYLVDKMKQDVSIMRVVVSNCGNYNIEAPGSVFLTEMQYRTEKLL